MTKKIKRWRTFFSPGIIVADTWDEPIGKKLEWPDNAYCYQEWKRQDIVDGDKVYAGEPVRVGKTVYHPDSHVESLAQVKSREGDTILVRNMECNKWPEVIWSRWNTWPQPFDPEKMEISR